ncbi:MAG TPA: hypothetical protein VF049_10090 [Nocardioidaceae bacterium]|jgi:hypothetical protein
MGVSATGSSELPMRSLRRTLAVLAAAFAVGFYLYGPLVLPASHAAAETSCNQRVGGDFRSFRLSWEVGTRPHWLCWDASAPAKPAMNLGWWVAKS